ncbi:hypothetical protein BPTFM16_01488 [Altererythrobacter insulae]|nr:hypothetical protein BPTFM16_01488 [Altererythrobacter insulae]
MQIPNALLLAVAFAVSSCAGDNPENVPLYGDWEMTTKLGSLTINGRVVPPENMPRQLAALEGKENICGEPMFIDRGWQEQDLNRQVSGDCTVERYDITPTRISGAGRCENVDAQADYSPHFTVDITQAEQSYRMNLTLTGDATIVGQPGRQVIRISAVQEGVRRGDC